MVRCEETNDQLKHLLGPNEPFPTSTPLPSRRTSAPEHHHHNHHQHHHTSSNGNATDNHHHCGGWTSAAEDSNCYCETDRLALSHIPSANWTYNDDEDEEKLSCSHTTEGSDENKRCARSLIVKFHFAIRKRLVIRIIPRCRLEIFKKYPTRIRMIFKINHSPCFLRRKI